MNDLSPNSTIELKSQTSRSNTIGTILLLMSGSYVNANPSPDISKFLGEKFFTDIKDRKALSLEHMGSIEPTSKSNSNHYRFRDFLRDLDPEKLIEINSKRVVIERLKASCEEINNQFEIDFSKFENTFNILSVLPIQDCIFEVSSPNSILLKLKVGHEFILILNIPVSKLDEKTPAVVYTLLESKQIVASNYSQLEDVVAGVKSYLKA